MLTRLRKKNLHQWLPDYARHLVRRARTPQPDGPRHILFALCDHYEPLWGGAPDDVGHARVDAWAERYPTLGEFRDSDGRPPRHGWFFPGRGVSAALPRPARDAGEEEVSARSSFTSTTTATRRIRSHRASRSTWRRSPSTATSRATGTRFQWAFIHGNWSLANGRPDGKWCGVDDELPMLHELGCYVDLTFPSAPDPCQPDKVNQIYWPTGDLTQRRSYEHGERARVGASYDDRLLMITGPLALARKGLGVRLENGALTGNDPPTAARVATWIEQGIHIEGRPEWVFVKVHTHGAIEKTANRCSATAGRACTQRCTATSRTAGSSTT